MNFQRNMEEAKANSQSFSCKTNLNVKPPSNLSTIYFCSNIYKSGYIYQIYTVALQNTSSYKVCLIIILRFNINNSFIQQP